MARTRRRRGRSNRGGSNGGNGQQRGGQQRGGQQRNGQRRRGGNRNNKSSQKRNRRQTGNGKQYGAAFWGDAERLPEPVAGLQVVEQPDAVVRSLGSPPLRNHEHIAGNYFTLVYDHAVRTAGALATAGGLIGVEDLTSELDDIDLEPPESA